MSIPLKITKAEHPQAEFCSAFVSAAVKKYEKKVGDFSPSKYQQMVLEGSQILTVGGLFVLGFGTLNFVGAGVKKAEEEVMKLCNKIQGLKTERAKRRKIDGESTKDFEKKFRRTFLKAAVIFYNIYEFQLQHIYLENKDKSLDGVGGLRKMGEFAGERALDHLTEILEGEKPAFKFDVNSFKRSWSKVWDSIKGEKLVFQVNSNESKNLSASQIFNNTLPVFYREENNEEKLWMIKGDSETFCKNYEGDVNYLRRPLKFEWDTFEESNATKVNVGVEKISIYKWPSVEIDELLREIELHYSTREIQQAVQVNEIHADVKQLLAKNVHAEGMKVVRKFNNIEKDLYSNLMKPKLAESLHNAIEKADAEKQAAKIQEKMVLVHGLGGVGKSSIARWFATQQSDKNVWWIDAETSDSIQGSFYQFAQCLQIESKITGNNHSDGQRFAEDVFNHIFSHSIKGVLLIYDNANQMNSNENDRAFGISDYLPKITPTTELSLLPVILITSQWSKWKIPEAQILPPVVSWEEEMTINFLKTRFNAYKPDLCSFEEFPGSDLEKSMKHLHNHLDGFPLATAIVASNIADELEDKEESKCDENVCQSPIANVRQSLCLLIREKCDVDFKEPSSQTFCTDDSFDYKHTMKTVWTSTINRLRGKDEEKYQLALKLLGIMAFIPIDGISLARLYFTLYPQPLTTEVKTGFRTSRKFEKMELALKNLEKLSLLEIVGGPKNNEIFDDDYRFLLGQVQKIQIHRLVQQRMRDYVRQDSANKAEPLLLVAEFVIQYAHRSTFNYEQWRMLKDLYDFQWPGKTYEQFMTILAQHRFLISFLDDHPWIKKYLKALKNVLDQRPDVDIEYSNFCDLALLHYKLRDERFKRVAEQQSIAADSGKLLWVLDQLQQHWKNHSFFYFGLNCLLSFHQVAFREEAKSKTISWLSTFFTTVLENKSCLPLLFECKLLMQLAENVGASIKDRKKFLTQTAQAISGLDFKTEASFPHGKSITDLQRQYFEALRYVDPEYSTLLKDKNKMDILFTFFSNNVTCFVKPHDYKISSRLSMILGIFRQMTCYEDFADSAFKSSKFMKNFEHLLERGCNETYPVGKLDPEDGIYSDELSKVHLPTLVLGFLLFGHFDQPQAPEIQRTFKKFVKAVEKFSKQLLDFLTTKKIHAQDIYLPVLLLPFSSRSDTLKGSQILETFVNVYNESKIAKGAVYLADLIREIKEAKLGQGCVLSVNGKIYTREMKRHVNPNYLLESHFPL